MPYIRLTDVPFWIAHTRMVCTFNMYMHGPGRARLHGKLSPQFNISSGARRSCLFSPLLFNFAIDEVMETAFTKHDLQDVQLHPDDGVLDLEYANDISFIGDRCQTCRAAPDKLELAVNGFKL
ncbi:unnamed protein product [Dicrocoelium dendriticum]|nr:unnamed protein product [Dicrocoelium dendriticum]